MLSFRRATIDDVASLHALVEGAYRGEASRAGWTTEADFLEGQRTDLDELTTLVRGPSTRIVLAHEGGELVGCVLLREEPGCAYLGMLSVRPTLQSSGVGRALLEEAERVARVEMGRPEMRMRVISLRDSLIAWYQRRGYALSGEREPFPYEEPRAGKPKRGDLEFVVMRKGLAG
jgi:ribosomal protein S18 acetylase RimI-like enzyme